MLEEVASKYKIYYRIEQISPKLQRIFKVMAHQSCKSLNMKDKLNYGITKEELMNTHKFLFPNRNEQHPSLKNPVMNFKKHRLNIVRFQI